MAGDASQITQAYNQRTAGATLAQPVQASVRLWYNPGRSSKKFYGPGIFVLGLSMFPPLLAALAMAKEGEQKTILQVYVSSISAHEFILGKIFAFMVVAFAECLLMLVLLFSFFGVSLAGDPNSLSGRHRCLRLLRGGLWHHGWRSHPQPGCGDASGGPGRFPARLPALRSHLSHREHPHRLRWLSNLIWGRYYIEIVRDALLQGGGWPATWYKVLEIVVTGAIFYGLAWRTLRRMQVKA